MNTKLSKNAYGVQSSFDKEKVVAHQIMADNYSSHMYSEYMCDLSGELTFLPKCIGGVDISELYKPRGYISY